MLWLKNVES
jgi:hypothetical protein